MLTYPRSRPEYDQLILANAAYFTVCRRIGPGAFSRLVAESLPAARQLARELHAKDKRPWSIYAVDRDNHDAFVEAYPPQPAAPGAERYAKKVLRWQRREALKRR